MSYAPHHPICDVCGEPKRQTNHWFQARVSVTQIIIEPFVAKSRGVKHLCGEGCMTKLLAGGTPGKPGALAMLHGVTGVVIAPTVIVTRNAAGEIVVDGEPIEFPIVLGDTQKGGAPMGHGDQRSPDLSREDRRPTNDS